MNRTRAIALLLAAVAIAAIAYTRKDTRNAGPSRPAPDGGPDWGGDPPPPPLEPGDFFVVELASEPATHYGNADADDEYRELGERVAAGRARYDAALSRAASESAYQGAVHRTPPPENVSIRLLHAAGAPDASAARFSLRTNDESEGVVERALIEALADPPSGDGDLYIGIGEAATPADAHARHVVVLMVRRAFRLDSTPRSAPLDSRWVARGELPEPFSSAVAHVLYPDGRLEPATLETQGRRFELTVKTGSEPGELAVGIDGVGAGGPGKLLQLSVHVGEPLPRRFELQLPAPDPPLADRAAAEALALELLNSDRVANGAEPLTSDPALAAIARAHSEDMQANAYFAHRSPTTGLAADRVRAAGYRASTFAENLAKNDSLAEAESSLLSSVGHRANLLSRDFTRVGVGVASAVERGRRQWYVTQLFARPVVEIDEDEVAATALERATAMRGEALASDADLELVAVRGAEQAADGDTAKLADRLGRRARDLTGRSISVSVQVIYRLDQLELPTSVVSDATEVIGIGVRQSASDPAGRIAVVVLTGQGR